MVLWELWSVKIVLGRYIINEFVYSLITVLYSAKVRLRRVANSFSVQVPATEFIVNPVKSLFSSFLGQETDASVKNLQVGNYDSFASSDCHRLSTCDLNMVIQHDEDDIKQTRLMT